MREVTLRKGASHATSQVVDAEISNESWGQTLDPTKDSITITHSKKL